MRNKINGFTLIELLVYMGVSTIILLSVTAVLFGVLSTYAQARTRHAQQLAFSDIAQLLSGFTEHTYSIDPTSTLDINLAQTGSQVTFLHAQANNNVHVFMNQNVLYAQIGSALPASLHSSEIQFSSCIFSVLGASQTGIRLTCATTAHAQFGLPPITTENSTFFTLRSYAP